MWIDIALYTSTFSVFLISIFIIIYVLKSRELQSKLDIYESILESVNLSILKKAMKNNNNIQPSNINLNSIDKRVREVSKKEINQSLIPIAGFVKNFSTSFKGFENRIDEKINSIAQETTPQSRANNDPNKLSSHQVIYDMYDSGLSLEEIELKTGTPTSQIKFILNLNGTL